MYGIPLRNFNWSECGSCDTNQGKDILAYVAGKATSHKPQGTSRQAQEVTVLPANNEQQTTNNKPQTEYQTPALYTGNVEVIEMDRMRKLIAKHMVDSKHTSAQWEVNLYSKFLQSFLYSFLKSLIELPTTF